MRNFEELKEAIKGRSFNESHLSKTQVVDLETVIGLIEDFEQCNIPDVGNNEVALKAFVEEFVEAWEDGMGGDTDLYRKAKSLL